MSTALRITKNSAERIVKAAVSDATQAERDAHQSVENALVERVIVHLLKSIGKAEELILARRLSPGWVRLAESISVSVQSTYVTLRPRGIEGSPPPRIPQFITSVDRTIPFSDPLCKEVYYHDQAAKALKEREEMLTVRVRAIVSSVTTYGKLAEIWPEGVEYWGPLREKAAAEARTRQLPATKVDELNSLLGIPKESASAA